MTNTIAYLPSGWLKVSLGDLIMPSKAKVDPRLLTPTTYLGLEHLESNTGQIIGHGISMDVRSTKSKFQEGDLLYGKLRPYLNKVHYSEQTGICSTDILVFPKNKDISNQFLKYRFLSDDFVQYANSNSTGVQHPRVSFGSLSEFPVFLPPLNEQRRIVTKIEELTAHSKHAREALEDIPTLIEQFKQSVLAAAFRGDLTADWREKNPDIEWKTTILSSIIHGKPRNGYSPKPVDFVTDVKSLTLSATTSGTFNPEYFKYINEEINQDSYLWLIPGDILIQRGNTLDYVGTSAVFNGEHREFIYPDLMMKIQVVEEKAIPEFVHYQLSCDLTRRYFRSNATGTSGNMPKINQKVVMETPITLPSLDEQQKIIYIIESIFSGLSSVDQAYELCNKEVISLDQSILSKAFRGELVPQDPNDEPADLLLDRIRAEREKLTPKKKTKRSRKKKSTQQLTLEGTQ